MFRPIHFQYSTDRRRTSSPETERSDNRMKRMRQENSQTDRFEFYALSLRFVCFLAAGNKQMIGQPRWSREFGSQEQIPSESRPNQPYFASIHDNRCWPRFQVSQPFVFRLLQFAPPPFSRLLPPSPKTAAQTESASCARSLTNSASVGAQRQPTGRLTNDFAYSAPLLLLLACADSTLNDILWQPESESESVLLSSVRFRSVLFCWPPTATRRELKANNKSLSILGNGLFSSAIRMSRESGVESRELFASIQMSADLVQVRKLHSAAHNAAVS